MESSLTFLYLSNFYVEDNELGSGSITFVGYLINVGLQIVYLFCVLHGYLSTMEYVLNKMAIEKWLLNSEAILFALYPKGRSRGE